MTKTNYQTNDQNKLPKQITKINFPNNLPYVVYIQQKTRTHYRNKLPQQITTTNYHNKLPQQITKTHYQNKLPKQITKTNYQNKLPK